MSVNISIGIANLQDRAKVIGTINEGTASSQTDEALKQLEAFRQDLDKVDQLRAAIISLEAAIREQDKPRAKTIIQQLTSGITSSLLANLISSMVPM